MATLQVGGLPFEAGLVIFDKDGTLVDFQHLWAGKTQAAVDALVAGVTGDGALRRELYATLGYDPAQGCFDAQSPVLTASMGKLYTIAAAVLYRQGWGWLPAELGVEQHFVPAMGSVLAPELIRPTADLPRLFGELAGAGVRMAVITSDDHTPTAQTLSWLGVAHHVELLIGADDPYPHKPAPEAIWATCDELGVEPARTLYVGDSTTDMLMAQRAGVGLRVAVRTGLMDTATLAPLAHLVVDSVGAIGVAPQD